MGLLHLFHGSALLCVAALLGAILMHGGWGAGAAAVAILAALAWLVAAIVLLAHTIDAPGRPQ